jgi:hypothetical protein
MTRQSLALASLLALAFVSHAIPAVAQDSSSNQGGRNISSMCRITGVNAQGALQTIRIRADGTQSWDLVEQAILNECRTNYRLNNCTVVTCRP